MQPDEQGRSLLTAIRAARHSIDIVVYEINDPVLNAELACAVLRGVNLRIIVNGQWWIEAGKPSTALDFAAQVLAAVQPPPGTRHAGTVAVNWASNNFQITHQKTVLIDAHRGDGLLSQPLPARAQAHVLTGNLLAYGYNTGHPASCPAPCAFWTARDFYIKLTEPRLVGEIQRVFNSDFSCAGTTVTNGLRDTPLPLTWSNGSTGEPIAAAAHYPASGVYPPFPGSPSSGSGRDEGNVRQRMLRVIAQAQRDLDVYNEEMADPELIDALAVAAPRLLAAGGLLRIVMTDNSAYHAAFNQLTAAGAAVHLFTKASGVLYIHAKVLMADGKTAYIGSTNISSDSMNYNRELGLLIDQQPTLLAPVRRSFEADFKQGLAWQVKALPPTSSPSPTSSPKLAQVCGAILPASAAAR